MILTSSKREPRNKTYRKTDCTTRLTSKYRVRRGDYTG